jgi:hypothetical protein
MQRLFDRLRGYTIPQQEIDEEARRLIVDHGERAIEEAESLVQRSQWSKGQSRGPFRLSAEWTPSKNPERWKRTLASVRKSLETR